MNKDEGVFLLNAPEIPSETKAAQSAADWMNLVLDSMPTGVLLRDASFKTIGCNQAFLELLGYDSAEDYEENGWRSVADEYLHDGRKAADALQETITKAYENGRAVLEWILYRKDRTKRPIESTFVPVQWQGETCLAIFTRDLADLYNFREIELSARRHVQQMLDAAPLLCVVIDKNGKVLEANKTVESFFDISDRQYFCDNFFAFLPEFQPNGRRSVEQLAENHVKAFKEGEYTVEWMHQKLNGDEIPCEVTLTRTRFYKYGDEDVILAYVRDISEQKAIIATLQHAHEQEQLARQAKIKMEVAEANSKTKSQFLARMSHEIRTPISAVMGISEIELNKQHHSPQVEESFVMINNAAQILLNIVNNILDISKIEAGKMELNPTNYHTSHLIENMTKLHYAYQKDKPVQFKVMIDENLPALLMGDDLKIIQIANNLLSNAFKYTEQGAVTLSVACEGGGGQAVLVISIADTGSGMSDAQLDILRRGEYIRFHEQEYRTIEGTGLGMSIVQNLAAILGASVDITSAVGQGTTVTLRIQQQINSTEILGREVADQLENFKLYSHPQKMRSNPVSLPHGRVLVVDDVEANLHVAKGLMSFYDLQIELCTNGKDAVERVRAGHEYDIIFMDYMMPTIDGVDAMKQIKALGYTKPMVALTASAVIGQADDLINEGFDDFLSKPILTDNLNAILLKYITPQARTPGQKKPSIDEYQHNTDLLKSLRIDFAKKERNAYHEITAAISNGDGKTARFLTHRLKGFAALIHEHALVEITGKIERNLDSQIMPSENDLNILCTCMNQVLNSIGALSDNAEILTFLDELKETLEQRSGDCHRYLERLRAIPQAAILVKNIERFNFKEARMNVDTLRDILE